MGVPGIGGHRGGEDLNEPFIDLSRKSRLTACGIVLILATLAPFGSRGDAQTVNGYLDARLLGTSSSGGFLLKLEDPLSVQINAVLTVVRNGRALGHLRVRSVNVDGSIQCVAADFHGDLSSTDRYVVGNLELGTAVPVGGMSRPVSAAPMSSQSKTP